jgi:C1A family cysteine protease
MPGLDLPIGAPGSQTHQESTDSNTLPNEDGLAGDQIAGGPYFTGWIRPDADQYNSCAALQGIPDAIGLPAVWDLTPRMTPIKNQNPWNSCVGHSVCAALEVVPVIPGQPQNESENYIWYNAKVRDGFGGNPEANRGTTNMAAIASAGIEGSCLEGTCPYSSAPRKPSAAAFDQGPHMKVLVARRPQRAVLEEYKALIVRGWPIIVGFDIFGDGSYLINGETFATGVMKMPTGPLNRTNGHSVLLVGYNDIKKLVKFKNSWGQVGDHGYFYMPYDYVQYTHDAWVIYAQMQIYNPRGIRFNISAAITYAGDTGNKAVTEIEGNDPKSIKKLKVAKQ